jgi:hypothetical protein
MVKNQAKRLQLMRMTVYSQFRCSSCSPLEVIDLHTSWAAVTLAHFFIDAFVVRRWLAR